MTTPILVRAPQMVGWLASACAVTAGSGAVLAGGAAPAAQVEEVTVTANKRLEHVRP